jgi:hypothetical protein
MIRELHGITALLNSTGVPDAQAALPWDSRSGRFGEQTYCT